MDRQFNYIIGDVEPLDKQPKWFIYQEAYPLSETVRYYGTKLISAVDPHEMDGIMDEEYILLKDTAPYGTMYSTVIVYNPLFDYAEAHEAVKKNLDNFFTKERPYDDFIERLFSENQW